MAPQGASPGSTLQVQPQTSGSTHPAVYQQSPGTYDDPFLQYFDQPLHNGGPQYTMRSTNPFSGVPDQYVTSTVPRSLPHGNDVVADNEFWEMMLNMANAQSPSLPLPVHHHPPDRAAERFGQGASCNSKSQERPEIAPYILFRWSFARGRSNIGQPQAPIIPSYRGRSCSGRVVRKPPPVWPDRA